MLGIMQSSLPMDHLLLYTTRPGMAQLCNCTVHSVFVCLCCGLVSQQSDLKNQIIILDIQAQCHSIWSKIPRLFKEMSKSELVVWPRSRTYHLTPQSSPYWPEGGIWRLQFGGFLAFQQYYTRGIISI